MTNSLDTLGNLLESKLQSRINTAKPIMEHMIDRVSKAAVLVGDAYGIGTFNPPGIDVQASLRAVKPDQKPVQGVTVYMSHASKVITTLTQGAFRHVQRKDTTTDTSYLALYVVEELLRSAVRATAAVARMEAAANTGPFASGAADFDHFDRLADKATSSLVTLYERIENATTGEEVVTAMTPLIQQRITGNVQRIYTSIKKAREKSETQPKDYAAKVLKSSKLAADGLRAVVSATKSAEATDVSAVGAAMKELYILRAKFPFYFGLPTRGSRGGVKTRQRQEAEKAGKRTQKPRKGGKGRNTSQKKAQSKAQTKEKAPKETSDAATKDAA
ncbi:MAG: hypothetical protein CMF62_04900 [Magnetococcales bacterium]|nr:hypothetical protein [Magnetococcales bacterium]